MDLISEVKNSMEAISILVVFVTVLFEIRIKSIQKNLIKSIPVGDFAKKRHRTVLIRDIFFEALPLTFLIGLILYISLPILIKIFKTSTIRFCNFNFYLSAYVLIFHFIGYFFILSISVLVKLVARLIKSK